MGNERKARESLVKRQYEHALKTKGRLPNRKEVSRMEREATDSAQRVEAKKRSKNKWV